MKEPLQRGPMTVRGALWAFAGAVVLAVLFHRIVGFPANVPLALGAAVLLVELIETAAATAATSAYMIARAFLHAVLAAFAGWLGVMVSRLLGWLG